MLTKADEHTCLQHAAVRLAVNPVWFVRAEARDDDTHGDRADLCADLPADTGAATTQTQPGLRSCDPCRSLANGLRTPKRR